MDFLSGIISKITELKYGAINDIADNIEEFVLDTDFVDEGIIESRVEYLKNKLRSTISAREKKEIQNEIVFLLSNLEKNFDEGYKEHFIYLNKCDESLCDFVKILYKYFMNEKEDILGLLSEIEEDIVGIEKHFLFYKVKGILLVDEEEYFEAIKYLKKAIELMPEDIECYRYLVECYQNTLHEEEKELLSQMIELLEGKNKDILEESSYEEE